MKTPPFLLLAVLLFWGWQSGLLLAGAIMGIVLESARFIKTHWDLTEKDFRRIFTFSILLAFATAVYAFASNREGELFTGPAALRNATLTSMRASTAFFRWLPMALFLIALAQVFSGLEKIPSTAFSFFARWRARRGKQTGGVNMTYPYFFVCLFSAGIHANDGGVSFFWGQCALVVWALWPVRSRRFSVTTWAGALAVVIGLAFFGQRGIGNLEKFLENYNAQWFTRFLRQKTDPMQSVTAIGHIGRLQLSGQIVIRLRTENDGPPPLYLRQASYRIYHSPKRSWYSGTSRNDFGAIPEETNQASWILIKKTNTASLNIACYLNGRDPQSGASTDLLPLPDGSGRLDNLNAYILRKNSEGAVLAEGPGLVIFDARYGPGQTIDSPPDMNGTNQLDLKVPTNEAPALDKVIAEMKISGADEEQKLRAVAAFFENNFTYSLWQGKEKSRGTNETPLANFLLNSRSGHCEYFATATVLLLRELKIPARYAVGYYVHEKSGHGYVVRERDAHAWCLVWDAQTKTWRDFDTTPASWVAEEGQRASFMQWFSDLRSWIHFQISKLWWGQSNLRKYVLWGLIPVLAFLLFQILFRRGRKRRRQIKSNKVSPVLFWPGLDSEFYRLEKKLNERGFVRQIGEPLSVWLEQVSSEPELSPLKQPLQEILRLHYRHRFDPKGLNAVERKMLPRKVNECLAALASPQKQEK